MEYQIHSIGYFFRSNYILPKQQVVFDFILKHFFGMEVQQNQK
jgi:hypothetical protein